MQRRPCPFSCETPAVSMLKSCSTRANSALATLGPFFHFVALRPNGSECHHRSSMQRTNLHSTDCDEKKGAASLTGVLGPVVPDVNLPLQNLPVGLLLQKVDEVIFDPLEVVPRDVRQRGKEGSGLVLRAPSPWWCRRSPRTMGRIISACLPPSTTGPGPGLPPVPIWPVLREREVLLLVRVRTAGEGVQVGHACVESVHRWSRSRPRRHCQSSGSTPRGRNIGPCGQRIQKTAPRLSRPKHYRRHDDWPSRPNTQKARALALMVKTLSERQKPRSSKRWQPTKQYGASATGQVERHSPSCHYEGRKSTTAMLTPTMVGDENTKKLFQNRWCLLITRLERLIHYRQRRCQYDRCIWRLGVDGNGARRRWIIAA